MNHEKHWPLHSTTITSSLQDRLQCLGVVTTFCAVLFFRQRMQSFTFCVERVSLLFGSTHDPLGSSREISEQLGTNNRALSPVILKSTKPTSRATMA